MAGTPPIDVLAIASVEYSVARSNWLASGAMQSGPSAECWRRQLEVILQERSDDVEAAQRLARDLGRLENGSV